MKQALIYSLKVWLTTAIASTLITLVIRYLFLFRAFNPYRMSNLYYNWLLQFGAMSLGYVVVMIPLAAMIYVTIFYSSRCLPKLSLKAKLYVVGVILAVLPDILIMSYAMFYEGTSHFFMYRLNISIVLNVFICAIVVAVSITYFKLKSVAHVPGSLLNSDIQQ